MSETETNKTDTIKEYGQAVLDNPKKNHHKIGRAHV